MDGFSIAFVVLFLLVVIPVFLALFCEFPTGTTYALISLSFLVVYSSILYGVGTSLAADDSTRWLFDVFQSGPFDDLLTVLFLSIYVGAGVMVARHKKMASGSTWRLSAHVMFWSLSLISFYILIWLHRAWSTRLPMPFGFLWCAIFIWEIWLSDLVPSIWFSNSTILRLTFLSFILGISAFAVSIGFAVSPYAAYQNDVRVATPFIFIGNAALYLILSFKVMIPLSEWIPARKASDFLLDLFDKCSFKPKNADWLSVIVFPFECTSKLGPINRYKSDIILCYGKDDTNDLIHRFGADYQMVSTQIDDYFIVYNCTRLQLFHEGSDYVRFHVIGENTPVVVGSHVHTEWVLDVGSVSPTALLLASEYVIQTLQPDKQSTVERIGFRRSGDFSWHHVLYHHPNEMFPLIREPTAARLCVPAKPAYFRIPVMSDPSQGYVHSTVARPTSQHQQLADGDLD